MFRTIAVLALLFCSLSAGLAGSGTYDRWFTGRTMRVDYFDTGTKGQEILSLDRVYAEGDWPGSRVNLVDTLNLGEYLFSVFDLATNQLIFSEGFSSLFNEWQTTDEALAGVYRTFSATVRMPMPQHSVRLVISRRDKRMVFHEIFTTVVDPNSPLDVDRAEYPHPYPVQVIAENGPASEKVDILILGDGYAKGDAEKFRRDAKHFNDVMFSTEPFKSRKKDFNVRAIQVESPVSGIDIPDKGLWRGNVLGCGYNTFGSARYVLTTRNKTVRDIAASAPYDYICILVNDSRYGGGGIYRLYTTTYTGETTKGQEWQMDYVYVHEFGHAFAGLGDEYYGSSTAYNDFYSPGIEPWEPNVAAVVSKENIKWKDLLTPGVALPTTWDKITYDSLEVVRGKLDRLAPDYYAKREPIFRAEEKIVKNSAQAGIVGAFEGSGYAAKGLYRPSLDCRMFSLSLVGFDPVCTAAIQRVIDWYAR